MVFFNTFHFLFVLVLTKRTPRLLDASPSAMRRLMNRCELAGFSIGRESFLIQEEMNDICRKWYIPPAFSIEYVSYYHGKIIWMIHSCFCFIYFYCFCRS